MKNVLITGAGRGIGLALTKEFANRGYRVLATYRNEATAKELIKFAESSGSVTTVTADVSDERTFGPLKEQLTKLVTLDILINNAGIIGAKDGSLMELDLAEVASVFEVNTFGPMRVSRLAIPFMKSGGTIAHITSQMGSIADNVSGGYYDYRMSKAALNMFNMSLSKEFPAITCLLLHPGWVRTSMGGADATVSPEESAKGLFKVITESTPRQSGLFFNFRGERIPW